jgi:hypothetical protein
LGLTFSVQAGRVTLAWDASTDSTVVGYKVYYGTASGAYTMWVDAGNNTSTTLSNLTEDVTYYFAATAYDSTALESDYSDEISYAIANVAPTINTPLTLSINQNAGVQTVNLTGISAGASTESQNLTLSAASSNPALIPAPSVTYTSPNTTGSLSFTPATGSFGTSTITVTVDDGSQSNHLTSVSFLVTVNGSGNQAPTLDQPANISVNENSGFQTITLTGITSGATNEAQTLTVTAASSNTGLIPNPAISYTSPAATGTLTFTPVPTNFGSAVITVTINDGGTSNSTIVRTFTVTVAPVNQPPTLAQPANLTINQNSGLQTITLTGISSGAGNESQTLTVTASSSNTGLIPTPTITYTSPAATGTLSFTPAAGSSGSSTILVTVNDGGASNNIITRTFTVTVNAVNAAPTLAQPAVIIIDENSGLQTVNLTGISSGATNESQTLTVTATSGNTNLIPSPTITYTSPATTGTLTFTPVRTNFGTCTITVTVNDGGASNNTVSKSFTVTVVPVNQTPTLSPLSDLSIKENSGLQTISLAGISSGATNESQTLTVTATTSNTWLIPTPTVTYTSPASSGTLTFTPAANSFGSGIVTVTVNDGGTSNNIITRSFTVTVNAVNTPPTLTQPASITIPENSGLQTITLTGITSGATNEADTLTVTAASSNTGLIPNPTVSYTNPATNATLTFTPARTNFGSATITVTVNDGRGSNNIVTRSFTVTVAPVNQPPTLGAIVDLHINQDAGAQTVNLSGISSGATNEVQLLAVTAASSDTSLIPNPTVTYSSPDTTGSLSFTPVAGAHGSAQVTVIVNDSGASNNTVSRVFRVVVNAPPTISAITNVSLVANSSSDAIPFVIGDAETAASNLVITAASSNTKLITTNRISLTGTDSNRTVTLTPLAGQVGTSLITLFVSDGASTASNSFTLTSRIPNAPTSLHIVPEIIGAGSIYPDLSTQILTEGSNYTVTAVAAAGYAFSGWSGSVSTNAATITIVATSGTILKATFVKTSVQIVPQIIGSGTITPDISVQSLTLGQSYPLTAVPSPGYEFSGWSGSVTAQTAAVTFLAASDTTLTATFVKSAYKRAKASFQGLVFNTNEVEQASSGSFTLSTTTNGKYSGKLLLAGRSLSFSGALTNGIGSNNIVIQKGVAPLTIAFEMGAGTLASQMTGNVSYTNWTASLAGDRLDYNAKTAPCPLAGTYTLILPGVDGNDQLPAGNGFSSVKVTSAGVVSATGTLADGTKFTQSASVSTNGDWPVYASLYSKAGCLISWQHFLSTQTNDISGDLFWVKPTIAKAKYYTNAFILTCATSGSTYHQPAKTNAVLDLGKYALACDGGNLAPGITNLFNFLAGSKIANLSSNKLTLSFSLSAGTFTGTVANPTNSRKSFSFSGAVFQKSGAAYGLLLGTNQSSQVVIEPLE